MIDSGLNDFFIDPQFTGLAVFGEYLDCHRSKRFYIEFGHDWVLT